MSNTAVTQGASPDSGPLSRLRLSMFSGGRGRRLREAILAYAFLFPAFLIVFVFGLFPLVFGAFESTLRGINNINGRYDGLGNYVRAIDSLIYVLGFWLSILLIYLAVRALLKSRSLADEHGERFFGMAPPAIVTGIGMVLVARFIIIVLPILLDVPGQMKGQERTAELFRQLLFEALKTEVIKEAFALTLTVLLVGLVFSFLYFRFIKSSVRNSGYFGSFIQITLLLIAAGVLSWLTWTAIQEAYSALEEGESLEIWSQLVTISAGIVLLLLSWFLWRSASHRSSTISTGLRLIGAAMLAVGAWILIAELPNIVGAGDDDWWQGLLSTVYYSLGTVPFQLTIALILATLLFQNIRGKTLFRIIYFLPYIAPFVGTAAAFRILFSARASAPINTLLTSIGLQPLEWLNEPSGIFKLFAGASATIPEGLAGPSLALVAIMIFGTWTYFGFNTVVFLAGLGTIPGELYEAASIDGASRWDQFRHVTLPLLSPTIYFLTLWSTIGTFKAFNHIWVLRENAALGTTDTASVVIFQTIRENVRFGYASALSILLLLIIMILTVVNNRIASRRVFYG